MNAAKYNPPTLRLTIGSRLGAYEILSSLGAGGMGEVYRARDSKLQRDVAIKVLPEVFALDPDRVRRFEREAQTLAALNHPNIAQVFGVTEEPPALVMELVEGEDLRERLERGPVPMDEALAIARQIADALEAAHEAGIVHRDLKPANVRVRADGTVKVLDFGLAKMVDPGSSNGSMMNSPTLTAARSTEIGLILGTAAYMAPEQARGKSIDKRADIWAFGCVVYELLTGRQAFRGDTVTDIFAALVHLVPDLDALPSSTPPPVRVLLLRCLEKDSRKRLRDIGEARILLTDPTSADGVSTPARASTRPWPWLLAGASMLVAIGALVWSALRAPATTAPPVMRASMPLPPHTIPEAVAISPDGRQLLILTRTAASERRLYKRSFDRFEPEEVSPIRSSLALPFYSPDSAWIAFFDAGKLVKVPAGGGLPVMVAETAATSGVWLEDDRIVLGERGKLTVVRADGGTPEPLAGATSSGAIVVCDYDASARQLFYVDFAGNHTLVQRLGREGMDGEAKRLLQYASLVRVLPGGYLLFREPGGGPRRMMVQRYDAASLSLIGSPTPVGGAAEGAVAGPSGFDVSSSGTLVYERGSGSGVRHLVWVNRTGQVTAIDAPAGNYFDPVISDDGRTIAYLVEDAAIEHAWVQDVETGARTRVTFDAARHMGLSWRTGRGEVGYVKGYSGSLAVTAARGGGTETVIGTLPTLAFGTSWTPDGKRLALMRLDASTGWDVLVLDAETSDGKTASATETIAATSHTEARAVFSPNGKLLAYASSESGRMEIYVHAYPVRGRPWQVSTTGGDEPRWSRDGKELFFRQRTKMLAVTVKTTDNFSVSAPRVLFEGDFDDVGGIADYDVAPDGRFLMLKPEVRVESPQLSVIVNWFDEFRRSLR